MEERKNTIDLSELVARLLSRKKFILIWCAASIVAGLVVAFSIPKEYKSGAKLAPEYTNRSSVASLSALVGMASSGLGTSSTRDAVYPELYPDIMESIPFLTGLFDVPVTVEGEQTTLFDYMLNHQKKPWWSTVLNLPFRGLGWVIGLFHETEEIPDDAPLDTFRLNKKQTYVASCLKKRLSVVVDKKTYVVKVSVMMQNPVIAADVACKVLDELRDYITEYRTEKSRQNLAYTQTLYDAAQADYFAKQRAYARYVDSHQDLSGLSASTESERLRGEMNLSYDLYTRMAQQLQAANAKVQEETPVFQIMQAPSVPIRKAKPSRAATLFVFLLLGFCISSSWVLFGKDFVTAVKNS